MSMTASVLVLLAVWVGWHFVPKMWDVFRYNGHWNPKLRERWKGPTPWESNPTLLNTHYRATKRQLEADKTFSDIANEILRRKLF